MSFSEHNPGMERMRAIFVRGVTGAKPQVPVSPEDLEKAAALAISARAFGYISGGAGEEHTVRANREGFDKWRLCPRMLQNVGERDLSITLLGKRRNTPFLLAPVGVLDLAHPDGDLAAARAAAALGIPMIFSNQASAPMEACAAEMGNASRWFQLYWSKSNDLVASLVQRAEACGCEAIVLTLDTTVLGWRPRDLANGYLPFMEGRGIAQYTSDPVFRKLAEAYVPPPGPRPGITLHTLKVLWNMLSRYPGGIRAGVKGGMARKSVQLFTQIYARPTLEWADLSFLREITRLPIFLKGILHPEDALRAVDAGMNGILVSNHGGRQVDRAIAAIDALPEVVDATGGQVPVLFDSGIRTGADAAIALALGASAVCIGRPYAYGLAVAGQQGAEEVLQHLIASYDLTLALIGCAATSQLSKDRLKRV